MPKRDADEERFVETEEQAEIRARMRASASRIRFKPGQSDAGDSDAASAPKRQKTMPALTKAGIVIQRREAPGAGEE